MTVSSSTVLVPGTVVWSAPAIPGFSGIQLVQAVPSNGGPDLYSIQLSSDGTHSIVQALMADGEQLWQTPIAAPLSATSVPDGAGGLIVTENDTCTPGQSSPLALVDLDPVYGQPTTGVSAAGVQQGNNTVYCYGNGDAPQMAVRGDGALFVAEPTNNGFPPFTEAQNGNYTNYSIPTSTNTTTTDGTINVQCCMGPPMVNTDGTAYVEYEVRTVVNNVITSDDLYLFQVNPDNSYSSMPLSSTTQNEALLPGSIIPDGNGGLLATWTISPSNPPVPQYPYQAVDISGGIVGTPFSLPFSPPTVTFGQYPSLVLGENGVVFAKGSTTQTGSTNVAVDQIASFNISSGSTNWTYQAPPGDALTIVQATNDGGVTINDSNTGVIQLSASGSNATAAAIRSNNHLAISAVDSTTGVAALQGAVPLDLSTWVSTASGVATALWNPNGASGILTILAQSASPMPHENQQGQSSPLYCQQTNVSCALAPESDGPDPIQSDVPNRQVVYWLFNLQNGTLNALLPSQNPPPVKIQEWENASNGAQTCTWQTNTPNSICESPNTVNHDTAGQLTDHMDAALAPPFTVQQQFLVDRQGVQVFWINSKGSWYGAWGSNSSPPPVFNPNQTASVTATWATISQINANTNAPTKCPKECDTTLPQAGPPTQ